MGSLFGGMETIRLPDAELFYWPDIFSADEAARHFQTAVDTLAWRQDTIVIAGNRLPVPRLNAWYGDTQAVYTYSGIRFEALPWTPLLQQLRERIQQQVAADTAFTPHFNSVLANFYRDGNDSVAWHADDEPELGQQPLIASLSLGAARRFCMKHTTLKQRFELVLPAGSLLVMAGATQHHWQHQVPKEKALTSGRVNLTFRRVHTQTLHRQ